MTLRVWIIGALFGLPLLVSGALAQTPAAAPAAAPSSAPASPPAPIPASPPPATTSSIPAANTPSPPAPTEGLVSPFMPMPAGPAPAAESAPSASPSAAPPPAQAAAPPKPKKIAPRATPRETALSEDPEPTLQPDTFFATAKASERYSAIVDAGGWPTDIVAVAPGAKGPSVERLRKRLMIEGYLGPAEAGGRLAWDKALTAAVKRFQAHMGLRETGIVSGATLKAINVPARERFNELASSANRLAGLNFSFEDRYVAVN